MIAWALALQVVTAQAVTAPAASLDAPMPPGFAVGYSAAQADQSIEERVPRGETVEAWTRMVTIQRLGGLAPVGPHAFAERLGALMAQACPGAIVAPIVDGTDGAAPMATMRVDCPLNPATGKPETMFGRIIAGRTDLHAAQYALRAKADRADEAAAARYLASVHLRR